MRKITASVLSLLCLFVGLAAIAGPASAQSSTPNPVTLTPATLFFSVIPGKTATAPTVLSNRSGIPVIISKIEIGKVCATPTDCGNTQFHVVSHSCGAVLENGKSCTLNVEFAPAALLETEHATLKVTFANVSAVETRTVALTGVSRDGSIN